MTGRKTEIEEGSGNVFADLGLPEPDDLLLKSQIVAELHRLVRERELTQTEAAKLMGITQPDLSKLLRGDLRGYSVERLVRMLTAFDRDVEIVVKPRAAEDKAGRITFKPDETHASVFVLIGYDPPTKILTIRSHDGAIRRHLDVPMHIYKALLNDLSNSIPLANIRDEFDYSAYLPHVEFDQQLPSDRQPAAKSLNSSRPTKGNLRRKPISSSSMVSAGYNVVTRTLELEFPSGDVYRYHEVPPEVWRAFEEAPSKGLFFSGEIRDRFAFERVAEARPGRSRKEERVGADLPLPVRHNRSVVRR
jgi:predicted XRE-type DNA-binding protein